MADITMMTWKEIRESARRGGIALIPIGSLEQHGPHLAVQTDTLVVTRVAMAVEERLTRQGLNICRVPTLWTGCSPHHLDLFTISLDPELYIQVLVSMGESLIAAGFQRIFFLNGHGGNGAPAQIAINHLALKHPVLVGGSTYWDVALPVIREQRDSKAGGMAHACELETSLVEYLLPEAVRMELAKAYYPELPKSAMADMTESGPVKVGYRFSDLNPEGNLGDPTLASPEKGQQLFEGIATAVGSALTDFARIKIRGRAE